ncbi:uncharacterized protein LOC133885549 [Phragmites australis]|uniref:uncharacterized protein LOC133885549 n=1 Tax=Phragmites australis TaxID=29695 RepID=UPI002D7915FA|nr:uncharacterized protein LOC133885549 [Phragmites australis]
MARLHWLEAILPLGIIGGMLCIMGNAQYFIHKAAHAGYAFSSLSRSVCSAPRIPPVLTRELLASLVVCVYAAEAHRERHVGRRHGAPRQEARGAVLRQLGYGSALNFSRC